MSTFIITAVEVRNYNVVYEVEADSKEEAIDLASWGEADSTVDEELETVVERYIVRTEVKS